MTKLVYIGGGHSGSTLLEYLLAASPETVACGEWQACFATATAREMHLQASD